MLISVRKSICPLALGIGVTASVSLIFAPSPGYGQSQQKQPAVQIKTLDDNKEVLRPIPTVLKAKNATLEKPKEQSKAATNTGAAALATIKANPAKESPAKAISAITTNGKTAATSATTKTISTATTTKKTTGKIKSAAVGAHFVPPPPPTVPTMLGDASDFGFYAGMPIEMLSREGLKDKAKEISIQYKDACQELEDHSKQKQEKLERAKEFEGLFQEGVVSRRELEASQKEAGEVNSDIDRLTLKVKELKSLLDRVNKRLAQAAAKKSNRKLIN